MTPASGYVEGTTIDGIELRDRVWLDLPLNAWTTLHVESRDR